VTAPDDPRDFYDGLAGEYHLIFADWWTSARRQGEVLGKVLRGRGVEPPAALLDCTCGIGTQALSLAAQGFQVTGSDLSGAAVERARAEADARGIDVRLRVADVRALPEDRRYAAVVSGDNSLPHLVTDDDLAAALASVRARLSPGGLFLASIRDYDAILRDNPSGVMPVVHDVAGERRIVGQAWRWSADRRTVEINMFFLRQQSSAWSTTVHTTTYRALRRHELTAALQATGFREVEWLAPEAIGYHQPVVTARA